MSGGSAARAAVGASARIRARHAVTGVGSQRRRRVLWQGVEIEGRFGRLTRIERQLGPQQQAFGRQGVGAVLCQIQQPLGARDCAGPPAGMGGGPVTSARRFRCVAGEGGAVELDGRGQGGVFVQQGDPKMQRHGIIRVGGQARRGERGEQGGCGADAHHHS